MAICATEVGQVEEYKDYSFAIPFSIRPTLFKSLGDHSRSLAVHLTT